MLVRGVERFRSAMKDAASEVEAPFLDHQLAENRRRDANFFIDLLHPKPSGNRLMAQELAQFLMEHGQLGPAQSP
jgi:lysophospholipase L1-like esterase